MRTYEHRPTFSAYKALKAVENIETFYTLGAELGRGSYGIVHMAERKSD